MVILSNWEKTAEKAILLTSNHQVEGSNPSGVANYFNSLDDFWFSCASPTSLLCHQVAIVRFGAVGRTGWTCLGLLFQGLIVSRADIARHMNQ